MADVCYEELNPLVQTALQQCELWKLTEAESSSLLDSLVSASERLSIICKGCRDSALRGGLTETKFPNLTLRLAFKQRKSMETLLGGMQDTINSFKSVSSEVASQYTAAMEVVFQRFEGQVSEEEGKKRHPTRPAIHDVLHWLSDLQNLYNKEVERKEGLLATLKCEEPETVANVRQQWRNTMGFHQIFDTIQYLRFTAGEQKEIQ